MLKIGVSTRVAGFDTSLTNWHGLLVRLLAIALIGMTFGLLFRDESSNLGAGVALGICGLIWWYLGPMTLLPPNAPLACATGEPKRLRRSCRR